MTSKEKIIVYTDGGSRGNPGPAGIGVIICNEKGQTLRLRSGQAKYSKDVGIKTNNEAEYEAVIFALKKIKQLFGKAKVKNFDIEIRMDSELVARQLTGKYKIEEERLFPLFIKIWNLKMDFENLSFKEVPRSANKDADRLANESLNKKEQKSMFSAQDC